MVTPQNKNNWAIILGGSSGLGLATAKKLAKEGFHICVIHRDRKSTMPDIEKAFEEIKNQDVSTLFFNLDALKKENRDQILLELKAKFQSSENVKILVHSLAKGNLKPMLDDKKPTLKNDDFLLTINAMAVSLYDWVKAIFDQDMFAADARIISFTSEGNQRAWKNYAAVSAAKVTLEAITRNIALEFAPHGIRANCIQAGVTDTASLRMIPGADNIKDFTKKRNPFNRLTRPEDVANVAFLLSTDEAAWINGAVIPVDGGERFS